MFRTLQIILFGFCFVAVAAAHHSTIAVYHEDMTIMLEGTVTQVEWRNPHIWFYIDVVGDDGNVTNWGVEFQSAPLRMLRRGWTAESLQVGDVIMVEGALPRNSELSRVLSRTTLLPDGRELGGR